VTTVRSQEKADKIHSAHSSFAKDKLETVIVDDIAKEGAFDEAVKSNPPFEAVVHTASPFHFNVTDIQKVRFDFGTLLSALSDIDSNCLIPR
jgi:hypothetical protein